MEPSDDGGGGGGRQRSGGDDAFGLSIPSCVTDVVGLLRAMQQLSVRTFGLSLVQRLYGVLGDLGSELAPYRACGIPLHVFVAVVCRGSSEPALRRAEAAAAAAAAAASGLEASSSAVAAAAAAAGGEEQDELLRAVQAEAEATRRLPQGARTPSYKEGYAEARAELEAEVCAAADSWYLDVLREKSAAAAMGRNAAAAASPFDCEEELALLLATPLASRVNVFDTPVLFKLGLWELYRHVDVNPPRGVVYWEDLLMFLLDLGVCTQVAAPAAAAEDAEEVSCAGVGAVGAGVGGGGGGSAGAPGGLGDRQSAAVAFDGSEGGPYTITKNFAAPGLRRIDTLVHVPAERAYLVMLRQKTPKQNGSAKEGPQVLRLLDDATFVPQQSHGVQDGTGHVLSVAFMDIDKGYIVCGHSDGRLRVLEAQSGAVRLVHPAYRCTFAQCVSAGGGGGGASEKESHAGAAGSDVCNALEHQCGPNCPYLVRVNTHAAHTVLHWSGAVGRLYGGARNGAATVWDMSCLRRFGSGDLKVDPPAVVWSSQPHAMSVTCFALLAADGRYFATGSMDCTIAISHTEQKYKARVLRGHRSGLQHLAYSSQYGLIVSVGSRECEPLCWAVSVINSSPHPLRDGRSGHSHEISAIIAVANSSTVITTDKSGATKVWDLLSMCCRQTIVWGQPSTRSGKDVARKSWFAAYNHNRREVLCVSWRRGVLLEQGAEEATQDADAAMTKAVVAVLYLKHFKQLATASKKQIRVWCAVTGRALRVCSLESDDGEVATLAVDSCPVDVACGSSVAAGNSGRAQRHTHRHVYLGTTSGEVRCYSALLSPPFKPLRRLQHPSGFRISILALLPPLTPPPSGGGCGAGSNRLLAAASDGLLQLVTDTWGTEGSAEGSGSEAGGGGGAGGAGPGEWRSGREKEKGEEKEKRVAFGGGAVAGATGEMEEGHLTGKSVWDTRGRRCDDVTCVAVDAGRGLAFFGSSSNEVAVYDCCAALQKRTCCANTPPRARVTAIVPLLPHAMFACADSYGGLHVWRLGDLPSLAPTRLLRCVVQKAVRVPHTPAVSSLAWLGGAHSSLIVGDDTGHATVYRLEVRHPSLVFGDVLAMCDGGRRPPPTFLTDGGAAADAGEEVPRSLPLDSVAAHVPAGTKVDLLRLRAFAACGGFAPDTATATAASSRRPQQQNGCSRPLHLVLLGSQGDGDEASHCLFAGAGCYAQLVAVSGQPLGMLAQRHPGQDAWTNVFGGAKDRFTSGEGAATTAAAAAHGGSTRSAAGVGRDDEEVVVGCGTVLPALVVPAKGTPPDTAGAAAAAAEEMQQFRSSLREGLGLLQKRLSKAGVGRGRSSLGAAGLRAPSVSVNTDGACLPEGGALGDLSPRVLASQELEREVSGTVGAIQPTRGHGGGRLTVTAAHDVLLDKDVCPYNYEALLGECRLVDVYARKTTSSRAPAVSYDAALRILFKLAHGLHRTSEEEGLLTNRKASKRWLPPSPADTSAPAGNADREAETRQQQQRTRRATAAVSAEEPRPVPVEDPGAVTPTLRSIIALATLPQPSSSSPLPPSPTQPSRSDHDCAADAAASRSGGGGGGRLSDPSPRAGRVRLPPAAAGVAAAPDGGGGGGGSERCVWQAGDNFECRVRVRSLEETLKSDRKAEAAAAQARTPVAAVDAARRGGAAAAGDVRVVSGDSRHGGRAASPVQVLGPAKAASFYGESAYLPLARRSSSQVLVDQRAEFAAFVRRAQHGARLPAVSMQAGGVPRPAARAPLPAAAHARRADEQRKFVSTLHINVAKGDGTARVLRAAGGTTLPSVAERRPRRQAAACRRLRPVVEAV